MNWKTVWRISFLLYQFTGNWLNNVILAAGIHKELSGISHLPLPEFAGNCPKNLMPAACEESRLINTQMGRTNVESYICDRDWDWKFEDTNNLEARPVRFCMHNAAIMDKAVGNAVCRSNGQITTLCTCVHSPIKWLQLNRFHHTVSSPSTDSKCRSISTPQCNIILGGNWQTVSYQGVHLQNTCYSTDKKGQKHALHTSQNSYSDNRHCTANNYYLAVSYTHLRAHETG